MSLTYISDSVIKHALWFHSFHKGNISLYSVFLLWIMCQQTCPCRPTMDRCGWTVGLYGKPNLHLSHVSPRWVGPQFCPLGSLYVFSSDKPTMDSLQKTTIGPRFLKLTMGPARGAKTAKLLWALPRRLPGAPSVFFGQPMLLIEFPVGRA